MKILITGGAGFIASHIVDLYISKGHKVVVVDDLSKGSRKNIHPKAIFYRADITDLEKIRDIFKKERPEIVNHHAALAAVTESVTNPLPTFTVNVLGLANVLLSFGEYGRGKDKKIIFSSTGGAMYGNPKKLPVSEKTPPHPLSPYGVSKLMGENLIKFYAEEYKFPYFIFRYANVFGPRQNPKGEAGIVAILSGLLREQRRPTLFGLTPTRDYVYVGDVARANLLALKKGKNVTVNIGRGVRVSNKAIFDEVSRAVRSEIKPIIASPRPGEIAHIALDARYAKKILGWKPAISLEKGIRIATQKKA